MRGISAVLILVACVAATQTSSAAPPALQQSQESVNLYSSELRNAQFQRLRSMRSVDVEYDNYGRVRTLRGSSGIHIPDVEKLKTGDSAKTVLGELKEVLMVTGSESLTVRHVVNAINGGRAVFMDVAIDGIPVIDGGVNIRVDVDGQIDLMGSKFVRATGSSKKNVRSAEMAKADLLKALEETGKANRTAVSFRGSPALSLWTNNGLEKTPIPVWSFDTTYESPQGESEAMRLFVDASTGDIRGAQRTQFGVNRTAYTMNYTSNQYTFLWNEGFPNTADPQAYSAYMKVMDPIQTWASAGLGQHYGTLGIAAHYSSTYNAFFSYQIGTGLPVLSFGDYMAMEDDAIAHEYGHGIYLPLAPPQPSGYMWWNEWFAANEFWGDLSAAMTEINGSGVNPNVWKISSLVLRDLSAPKSVNTDYRDWYWNRKFAGSTSDVAYKNSTIYGHALYLLVSGGLPLAGGGLSIERPHSLDFGAAHNSIRGTCGLWICIGGSRSDWRFDGCIPA